MSEISASIEKIRAEASFAAHTGRTEEACIYPEFSAARTAWMQQYARDMSEITSDMEAQQ